MSQQFSEEVGHLGMTQQFFSEADDPICTPSLDMIQTSSPVLSGPLPDEDDLNLRYEPITNFVTFVKHSYVVLRGVRLTFKKYFFIKIFFGCFKSFFF